MKPEMYKAAIFRGVGVFVSNSFETLRTVEL
jgi:hypothetical protein